MNQLETLIALSNHLNNTLEGMHDKNDYTMNVTIEINGQSFVLDLNADVHSVLENTIETLIRDEKENGGQ